MNRFKGLIPILIAVLTVLSLADAIRFEDNPHCTQVVSLHKALFEMEPHQEERPVPLIYVPPYAAVLRAYFATVLFFFLLCPMAAVLLRLRQSNRARRGIYACAVMLLTFGLSLALAVWLAGERFTGLYVHTILWTPILYIPAFLFLIRREKVSTRNTLS